MPGLIEILVEIVFFLGLGVFLKHIGILNEVISKKSLSLSLNILLPLIVFRSFATVKISLEEFSLPLIGLAINLSLLAIAYFLSEKLEMNNAKRGSFLLACSTLNIGLIGLPFISLFFNTRGVATASLLDIGNSVYVFFIAFIVASYFNPSKVKRSLKNNIKNMIIQPYIISIIFGLAINFLGLKLPQQVNELISLISLLNAMIILVATGFFIKLPNKNVMREVFLSVFVKIVFGSLIGLAFTSMLNQTSEIMGVIVIVASLPPAFMTLVHASAENLDLEFASVLLGSLLAIGIPVIVFYGLFFSL
ncbi:MAG: AEC family transporter [Nitrososphaerota archaeon]|nr:AEC family transporter [Nitrososphaerota archaeon]